jgi:hypothetical protein
MGPAFLLPPHPHMRIDHVIDGFALLCYAQQRARRNGPRLGEYLARLPGEIACNCTEAR